MAPKYSESNHLLTLLFVFCNLWLVVLSVESPKQNQKQSAELTAAASVAVQDYKSQSISPRSSTVNRRYGYPYAIAPTLTPIINARSDEYENEAVVVSKPKPYGSKISISEDPLKKSSLKKYKAPFSYGAARRQGFEAESPLEKRFRAYKEPKYRNFDELESRFRPRRIDIREPYSGYEYVPKSSRRPPVSPRDPYLSPSNEPTDGFYPVPNSKSYSAPYIRSGSKAPAYGAGMYEDPSPYQEDLPYDDYEKDNYQGPSQYPSSGGHYEYQEDYEIESNKPITGDIRKRLLDYAGASDLYEGEPDYLQRVARNKNKYGQVANDYYAYGGPGYKSSYRDFPYVESKVRLVKKPRL